MTRRIFCSLGLLLAAGCGMEAGPAVTLTPASPILTTSTLRLSLPSAVEGATEGAVVQEGLRVSPPVAFVARWVSDTDIDIVWQEPLTDGVRYQLDLAPPLGQDSFKVFTSLLRLVDARRLGTDVVVDFSLPVEPADLQERLRMSHDDAALSWTTETKGPSTQIRITLDQPLVSDFLAIELDASLTPAAGGTALGKSVRREVREAIELTLLSVEPGLIEGRRALSLLFDGEVDPGDFKSALAIEGLGQIRRRGCRLDLFGDFSDTVAITIRSGLKSADGRVLEEDLEHLVSLPGRADWPALAFVGDRVEADSEGRLALNVLGVRSVNVDAFRLPIHADSLRTDNLQRDALDHRRWTLPVSSDAQDLEIALPQTEPGALWALRVVSPEQPWLRDEAIVFSAGLSTSVFLTEKSSAAVVQAQGTPVEGAQVVWHYDSGRRVRRRTDNRGFASVPTLAEPLDALKWVVATKERSFSHVPLEVSTVDAVSDRFLAPRQTLVLDRLELAPTETLQGILLSTPAAQLWLISGANETRLGSSVGQTPFVLTIPVGTPHGPARLQARVGERIVAQAELHIAPAGPTPFLIDVKSAGAGAFTLALAAGDFGTKPDLALVESTCFYQVADSRWHGRLPAPVALGQGELKGDAPLTVSCPMPPAGTQVVLQTSAPEPGGGTMVGSATFKVASEVPATNTATTTAPSYWIVNDEGQLAIQAGRPAADQSALAVSTSGRGPSLTRTFIRHDGIQVEAAKTLSLQPPVDFTPPILSFNYSVPAGKRPRIWAFAVDPKRTAESVQPDASVGWMVYDSGVWDLSSLTKHRDPSLAPLSANLPHSQSSVVKGPLRPSGAGFGQFSLARSSLPNRCRIDVLVEFGDRLEVHSVRLPDVDADASRPPWLRVGDSIRDASSEALEDSVRFVDPPQAVVAGTAASARYNKPATLTAPAAGILRIGPTQLDSYRAVLSKAELRSPGPLNDAVRLAVFSAFSVPTAEVRQNVLAGLSAGLSRGPDWQVILSSWSLRATGGVPEPLKAKLRALLNGQSGALCASARFLLALERERSSGCAAEVPKTSYAELAAAEILKGNRNLGFEHLQNYRLPDSAAELSLSLLALLRVAPNHSSVANVRDRLVGEAIQGSWKTPEADALAALALARSAFARGAVRPYWGSVLVNGRVEKRFSNERRTEVPLSAAALSQGVQVTVTGAGTPYLGLASFGAVSVGQQGLQVTRTVKPGLKVRRGDVLEIEVRVERPEGEGTAEWVEVREPIPAGVSEPAGARDGALHFEADLAPGESKVFSYRLRALWAGRFLWPGTSGRAPWVRPEAWARDRNAHLTVD